MGLKLGVSSHKYSFLTVVKVRMPTISCGNRLAFRFHALSIVSCVSRELPPRVQVEAVMEKTQACNFDLVEVRHHTRMCEFVYMHACMHVCMDVCMYVCMYVCMHAYMQE